jgi:hypothetical protein
VGQEPANSGRSAEGELNRFRVSSLKETIMREIIDYSIANMKSPLLSTTTIVPDGKYGYTLPAPRLVSVVSLPGSVSK